MANYTVCALYKFTSLPDFQKLQSPIRSFLEQHEIMGTILLAHEGINGTISGSNESVQKFISTFHCFLLLASLLQMDLSILNTQR